MNCSQCGKELAGDAKFCSACGTNQTESATETPAEGNKNKSQLLINATTWAVILSLPAYFFLPTFVESMFSGRSGSQEHVSHTLTADESSKENLEETVVQNKEPSGPKVLSGSAVCSSLKSMYRANAIERANNPYVDIPADCLVPSNDVPVDNVQYVSGFAKITLNGGGQYVTAWTAQSSIVD